MKRRTWALVGIGIAAVMGLSRCITVETHGYKSDYDKLTQAQQARVKRTSAIDTLTSDGNVYRVSAVQMKDYLAGRQQAVVYSYVPYCTAEGCVEPVVAAQQCKEAGVELVLIGETMYELFEKVEEFPLPVFVIDNEALNTDWRDKYVKLFYGVLTETEGSTTKWGRLKGNFCCFNRGQFVKQCHTLDEALALLGRMK